MRLQKTKCGVFAEHLSDNFEIKFLSGKDEHDLRIHYHDFHELLFIVRGNVAFQTTQTVRKGLVHVPEGRLVFPGLSVRENLEMGTINWHGFFGNKSYEEDLQKVYELFPRLEERKDQKAWSLSGGEQQMLAIGRGMMARPKLLMLDEPSMGLAPKIVDEMFKKILEINQLHNVPVLLIEQNANLALEIADYAYVLDQGKIAAQGPAKELRANPQVTKSYLGILASEDGQ